MQLVQRILIQFTFIRKLQSAICVNEALRNNLFLLFFESERSRSSKDIRKKIYLSRDWGYTRIYITYLNCLNAI